MAILQSTSRLANSVFGGRSIDLRAPRDPCQCPRSMSHGLLVRTNDDLRQLNGRDLNEC